MGAFDVSVQGENYALYLGDTPNVLTEQMADVSADVAICDPPYFIGFAKFDFAEFNRNVEIADAIGGEAFNERWIKPIGRILGKAGTLIIHGIMRNLDDVLHPALRNGWKINDFIVWRKPNPTPTRNPLILKRTTEAIVVFNRADCKITERWFNQTLTNEKRTDDVWEVQVSATDCKDPTDNIRHPCQKPSAIIDKLIDIYCPPDGLVLDPFAGSGIVGERALKKGRRYVGIDNDAKWLERVKNRLDFVNKARGDSLCGRKPTSGE